MVQETDSTCPQCGTEFEFTCPECEAVLQSSDKNCPSCGAILEEVSHEQ